MRILSSVEFESAEILLEGMFEAKVYSKHGLRWLSEGRREISSQAWVANGDPNACFVIQHAWEDLPVVANRLARQARKFDGALPRMSERIAGLAQPIFDLLVEAPLQPPPESLVFEIPDSLKLD